MERTPEVVKKGLECCLGDCHNYHCDKCPYMEPDTENYDGCPDNGRRLSEDALSLIQQLEAQVHRWIRVEDRLPEKDQLVLFVPTCNSRSIYVGTLSHVGSQGSVMFEHRNARAKTKYYSRYWMPLPLPPSSPDGESTSLGDGG